MKSLRPRRPRGATLTESVTALTALILLLKHVREADGQLALSGVSGHPSGILEVMALDRVFSMHKDSAQAIEALH